MRTSYLMALNQMVEETLAGTDRLRREVMDTLVRVGLIAPRCHCCGGTGLILAGERLCIACRNPYPSRTKPRRRNRFPEAA